MSDIVATVLAWCGTFLVVLAAVGITRMPDLYSRLQASSKAPALGIALLALAVAIQYGGQGLAMRALALVLLMFVTQPVSAHLIGRAGFVTGVDVERGTVVEVSPPKAPGERPTR